MKRTPVVLALSFAWSLGLAATVSAQDRPVVFLHGLFSSGDTWAGAAQRLSAQLAIAPHVPTTDEGAPYAVQAAQVQNAVGGLDGSVIAIGHSNGGIVARQWSQAHGVSGIITVGTPHFGAPILPNFASYANFGIGLLDAVFAFINEFNADCCTWRWILSQVIEQVLGATGLFDLSLGKVFLNLGLNIAHPVVPEMFPGSSYLNGLNASWNLGREAAEIGSRVGIVSVAHNFYHGGPVRAAFPEHADAFAVVRDIAQYALYGYGGYVLATAPLEDFHASHLAHRMFDAAAYLGAMDDWWCQAVSWPGFGICWENDALVPVWSQNYGALGAIAAVVPDGPTHTQETSQSDGPLTWALTTFMNVTDRYAPPPPPPPPPPSGADTLSGESGLHAGESLISSDGRFRLDYQWDGNLVLYDEWGNALWWSGTLGSPGIAWMRSDGGFIIYNSDGEPVWDSGTRTGVGGCYLRLENSGTLVIYLPDGTPVWWT
jgi:pimeloyl-ACP methyl ester carboxylesterase